MEQFWRFYSHLVRPGDLSGHSDFHLFKEGIKPMWEVINKRRLPTAVCLTPVLPLTCLTPPPSPSCLPVRMSPTAAGASGSSACVKVWPVDSGRTSSWPCWESSSWWERRSVAPSSPYASRYGPQTEAAQAEVPHCSLSVTILLVVQLVRNQMLRKTHFLEAFNAAVLCLLCLERR